MVWVDKTTGHVGGIGIADSNAHNVLKRGMNPGDSLTIESTVGVITGFFDDPLTNFVIILTVGMFHDNQTPNDAVTAGYDAFQSAYQDGVRSHLLDLNSSDQSVVDQARQQISDAVTAAITSAISNSLSTTQKGEVAIGILTLDSTIGSASTSFSNLVNTDFTLTIGNSLDNYEIAGSLTIARSLGTALWCDDERTAVNQATEGLNAAKLNVMELQAEFQTAIGSKKQELGAEIRAADKDVAAAQNVLDEANKALQACLNRFFVKLP
jgi:hypothetical protein